MRPMRFWDMKKKKKRRKPLTILTPDELKQINHGARVLTDAARAYQLMLQGQRTLWFSLRQKYGLPEDIDLDSTTGAIYAKESTVENISAKVGPGKEVGK